MKWLYAICALVIFIIFSPNIDQYLALASYTESTKTFYGERALWCKIIYHAVPVITATLILMPLIWFIIQRHNIQMRKSIIRFGLIVYLALSFGPGVLVNVVFKDHWGRPRPYQVLRDGKEYSPFWQPHFSSHKDNSFPGGHASIGFFLGVPFLALGRRKTAVTVSLISGVVVGGVRILQGGHYFSDVVFSGIFVWLTATFVIYGISKLYGKVSISE